MCKHLQILANTYKTCNCCNHFQTIAISCKLVKSLANIVPQQLTKVHESERPQPDIFHSRTGHTLDLENSRVFKQLKETEKFAERNQMKINHRKTKIITFNPCRNVDFTPEIKLGNTEIEVVEEIKLLGLTIRSDLKWTTNTQNMILKANKRLWMLHRLKNLGAKDEDLLEMYVKQI